MSEQFFAESPIPSPNYCFVCGDSTKCYHYGVPSCSGCRIFFKRTIISQRTYGCDNNGDCNIRGKTYCRQCRFDRCVRVGMNPASVKSHKIVDFNAVVQFVESRKRVISPPIDEISLPSTSSSPEIPVKMPSIKLPQPMDYRDVDYLLFLEMKVRKLRESDFNPDYMYTLRLKELITRESELGNVDRYNEAPTWPTQWDLCNGNPRFEIAASHKKAVIKHWFAIDLILSIDMAKTLPIYQHLDPLDKEAFITNAIIAVALFTQSYYSHEKHSEVIAYPDGMKPICQFQRLRQISKLESEVFARIVHPVKRIDLTREEYVLLKAIIFCNPACSNISDAGQQLLERESERYSQTLLKYMQSIHGAAKGASRYSQVLSIMEAMIYFAERLRELHLITTIKLAEEGKRRGQKYRSIFVIDDCL